MLQVPPKSTRQALLIVSRKNTLTCAGSGESPAPFRYSGITAKYGAPSRLPQHLISCKGDEDLSNKSSSQAKGSKHGQEVTARNVQRRGSIRDRLGRVPVRVFGRGNGGRFC